jgi:transcriptional regulator with XRE-family HTH domain
LTKYERGERALNNSLLLKISDYFGVSTDYLLGKTDVEEKNQYLYTSNLKSLIDFDLKELCPFFTEEEESAIRGLLANYLSIPASKETFSLDLVYLISKFFETVTLYRLAIATELYVQDGKNAKERSWIVGNF